MAHLSASGEDVIGRIRCPQFLLLARNLLFNSPGDSSSALLACSSDYLFWQPACQSSLPWISAADMIICSGNLSVSCPCLGSVQWVCAE